MLAAVIASALATKTGAPVSADQIGRASCAAWFGAAKGAEAPGRCLWLRAQKMCDTQFRPGVRSARRIQQGFFRLSVIVPVTTQEFPRPGGLGLTNEVIIAVEQSRPRMNGCCWFQDSLPR